MVGASWTSRELDHEGARGVLASAVHLLRLELEDAEIEYRLACDDYATASAALDPGTPRGSMLTHPLQSASYADYDRAIAPYHERFHATMRRASHLSIAIDQLAETLASYTPRRGDDTATTADEELVTA